MIDITHLVGKRPSNSQPRFDKGTSLVQVAILIISAILLGTPGRHELGVA